MSRVPSPWILNLVVRVTSITRSSLVQTVKVTGGLASTGQSTRPSIPRGRKICRRASTRWDGRSNKSNIRTQTTTSDILGWCSPNCHIIITAFKRASRSRFRQLTTVYHFDSRYRTDNRLNSSTYSKPRFRPTLYRLSTVVVSSTTTQLQSTRAESSLSVMRFRSTIFKSRYSILDTRSQSLFIRRCVFAHHFTTCCSSYCWTSLSISF